MWMVLGAEARCRFDSKVQPGVSYEVMHLCCALTVVVMT